MKKLYLLFVVLLLTSNGFGQIKNADDKKPFYLHEAIETYESGNIRSITYHIKKEKKTYDGTLYRIEKWKKEGYSQNGQKSYERRWHPNGQKIEEKTYKNGIENGLRTEWYDNGQKRSEGTFKDGKQVGSTKRWNKDGSVRK